MTSSDTTVTASPSNPPTSPPFQSPQASPPQVAAPPLRVRPPLLSFRRPTPSTTSPDSDAAASSAADPVDAFEESGSTRSSKTEGAVKVDTASLRDIARGAVLTVSRYIHSALAHPELDPDEEELWIAREKDQAQIGDPIATVISRKGLGADVINADVANMIEVGIGVAAYVIYHAGQAWNLRRAAKRMRQMNGTPTQHGTDQPA
jgi:hypothetical protein